MPNRMFRQSLIDFQLSLRDDDDTRSGRRLLHVPKDFEMLARDADAARACTQMVLK